MYSEILVSKINECCDKNEPLNLLLEKKYGDVNKSYLVLTELNDFILSNNEIYQSNNFQKLIYEAFINLNNSRFTSFLRNLVNNHPNKKRTYSHMINDIKEKLEIKYDMPKSYYTMNRHQLDRECDKLLESGDFLLLGQVRKFIKENFIINDYKSFVYENVDQAKKILKSIGEDDTNKTYIRLKTMLKDHPGYLGVFTFYNKIEKIPFARLKNLFSNIIKNHAVLNRLKRDVVNYMSKSGARESFKTKDGRVYTTYFEKLEDDLAALEESQMARTFANEYPRNLRTGLYRNSDYIEIIKTLTQDKEKLELYKKFWLKKVSRYKTQDELLKSLMGFVFSNTTSKYLRDKINDNYQLKLIYDDGDIIIIRVLSQDALKEIANDTSWCIKDSLDYWCDYVGNDNIQLVIFNLTLLNTDVNRKIGITIYSHGGFNTAHNVNDSYVSKETLEEYLKKWTSINFNDLYSMSKDVGNNEYYSSDEISSSRYD